MEEDDEYKAPFWLPSSDSFRRRDSLVSFNSSAGYVVLLLAAAVAFLLVGVPSLTSHVFSFRPQSVQKSWDYLNLVLVLFAVLCGFLSRNSNGGGDSARSAYGDHRSFNSGTSHKSNPSTPLDRWHEFSDRSPYGGSSSFNRMRSSSSYPDLRQQESAWSQIDDRRRFFDDTRIYQSRRWREEEEERSLSDFQSKSIHVDRVEVQRQEILNDTPPPSPREPSPPPPTSPPRLASPPAAEPIPPPLNSPPRPKVAKRRPKRVHDAVAESHVLPSEAKEDQVKIVDTYKLPPPLSPLPPSPLHDYYSEQKSDSNEKKRGGSATKDFLTVLRRKKKKQRQKSVESFDFDSLFGSSNSKLPPPSPSPSPPPLPSPSSVFQNLFSMKNGRAKKSQHGPPPPPPPPPPPSRTRSQAAFSQAHSNPPITATKPAPPVNSSRYEYPDIRNRSRQIPIPPPPPPPPFKVPEWKFVVRGDYARIRSGHTSRSNSPDPIEEGTRSGGESPSSASVASSDASDPISPALFCRSPDVDTKADNFIARFRAGLQLEKVNSMKQRTKSNLGPDPIPDPGPLSV